MTDEGAFLQVGPANILLSKAPGVPDPWCVKVYVRDPFADDDEPAQLAFRRFEKREDASAFVAAWVALMSDGDTRAAEVAATALLLERFGSLILGSHPSPSDFRACAWRNESSWGWTDRDAPEGTRTGPTAKAAADAIIPKPGE